MAADDEVRLDTTITGRTVVPFEFKAKTFLNRAITIYGPSGTGKTAIVRAIMDILRPHIDQGLVISPTQPSNGAYTGYMHPVYIRTKLSRGPKDDKNAKVAFLKNILDRQEMLIQMFKKASNIGTLKNLHNMISIKNREMDSKIRRTIDLFNQKKLDIQKHYSHDRVKEAEVLQHLTETVENVIRKLYKFDIEKNRSELLEHGGELTDDMKYSLQYLNLNPQMLLIFDDCAAELKPCLKTPEFRSLFYMGRHAKVTVIVTCQDDTDLDPNIRKNVFTSIFTDRTTASAFFERGGTSKTLRMEAAASIAAVFGDVDDPYRKLYYIRDDPDQKFYYYTVPISPPILFGSAAVLALADRIRQTDQIDTSNPYFERFTCVT